LNENKEKYRDIIIVVHDVLSQAWNAEGSPFKGQTFDPSKINVGQGGMVTINDNDDTEQK
jgi:hypothetical protein